MKQASMSEYKVRPARKEDRVGVVQLVPRLREFGSVAFRPPEALDAGETRTINQFFDGPHEGARLWIAQADCGEIVGAAYAEVSNDYFTKEPHAHLGILVVAGNRERAGVAGAMLEQVEMWAASAGFRFITLNVFSGNDRAKKFYERHDFKVDTVRYIKPVTSNVSPQQGVLCALEATSDGGGPRKKA